MKIENTVEVDAPIDRVWALVNDIPRVAPCMPGAALTGVVDGETYEGTVAVKLGPLRMSYKGKVVVEEVDQAAHSARLAASGKDVKGAGTARATVQTKLEAVGDAHTRLLVTSDVQLTGKVASFGRGGAINDVASRLFGQFADCLRATLESEPAPPAGSPPPAPDAVAPAPAGSAASVPTATAPAGTAPDPGTATQPSAPAPTLSQPVTATPRSAPVTPTPARAPEALDAGSLVGTVIKGRLQALVQAVAGFFGRLFGRGRNRQL